MTSNLQRLVSVAAITALAMFSMGLIAKDYLAGSWMVTVMPDEDARREKAKDISDEWTFKPGQFSTVQFAKLGFAPAEYEDDTRGISSVTFKTALQSEKEGVLLIEGSTATGTELRGTIKWKKPNGDEWNYTFQGEKKPLR